jgi:L-alanine-DL-glutamate epimerase-like enolase superfamily enzyme
MKITNAIVNITSPGRNFVTLKIETDEGIYGLGDGTLNRGHLAVSLSGSLLAARAGDDGGDCRGGRGAVGHQGQGAEYAGL